MSLFVVAGLVVKFTKPALTVDEQVQLLRCRGMDGDAGEMRRRLQVVNYYRLSGYWFHRKLADDTFRPGTRFSVAWDQYVFDRKLRLLVMDAIERVEVALRTKLSYHHAHHHGPFGYATAPAAFATFAQSRRAECLQRIREEVERADTAFIEHFSQKYGDEHPLPPIWMASEVMSFGTVIKLWQWSSVGVQRDVADAFGVAEPVLKSWLWCLNEVRNICAHHGRLWNWELGNKPKIPRRLPDWQRPTAPGNDRVYVVLTLCAHSLARFAPGTSWPRRVRELLNEHPQVPTKNMGFPERWLECPIWKEARDA